MELVFGIITVALLAFAALVLKLLGDRTARRRAGASAQEADYDADGPASSPGAGGAGITAETGAEQARAADDGATLTPASRLARVRAARGEDSAPAVRAPAPPPPAPPSVRKSAETVSAVLRRQVPIRDDHPRSWLGGLPMMPDSVEWPRGINDESPEKGEVPLHFLAQIACEDLPADLWGGIGPRSGWLLFFINPNHHSAEDEGLHRVIHTAELGTERQPPADCGPVHDKVYTGGSYNWLKLEDVPAFWRRWPLDIVTMPNALTTHEQEGSMWKTASPDNLSDILYADVPYSKTTFASPMPRLRPLTFGQARTAVEALALSLRYKVREPVDAKARDLLLADGGYAQLLESLEVARARIIALPERGEGQNRWLAFLEAALPEYAGLDAESLLHSIAERHQQWLAWREKIAGGCDQIAAMLGKSNADEPLQEAHWQQLQATFAGKHFDHLELRHSPYREGPFPVSLMLSRETIEMKLPPGMDQIGIEYYCDPARRDLLPADYAASQEPAWRGLYNNRPHRMGGYHDGLQSEPIKDPGFGRMLLMQIATDDAMDWCWGDGGVYFFWIRPEHLAACDFGKVDVWLECH